MPDALNEVFRVNNLLEDIGGLVDPEDLPEVVEGGGGGNGGNDELDSNDGADYTMAAKKTFVTSRPGRDGGSVTIGGGNSTTRRAKQSSASLAEKLLASISPDVEARQNDNRAVMRLYLQQIRAHEDTIRMRELQNDSLRQDLANFQDKFRAHEDTIRMRELQTDTLRRELTNLQDKNRANEDTIRARELQIDSLRQELTNAQDKVQSTLRELSSAERRADRLETNLNMLKMMGTRRGRSSRRTHATTHRTLSPSSSSNGSLSSSQSPLRSALKGKRRRVDLPVNSKILERGNGEKVYQDGEDEAAELLITLQRGAGGM
jgi:hypothetical protein